MCIQFYNKKVLAFNQCDQGSRRLCFTMHHIPRLVQVVIRTSFQSKHVNKIGSSTLILVIMCGELKNYLRGVVDSANLEFVLSDSKNECSMTQKISSLPELSTGTVSLSFNKL